MLLGIFIGFPWLAGIIGGGFVLLYGHSGRVYQLITGLVWLLYTAYEYSMKRRILCSGECNIRVDILLIYPVLLVFTVIGVVSYVSFLRSRKQHKTTGTGP